MTNDAAAWTPRQITPAQRKDHINTAVTMGYTVTQIARYLKVSVSTIRRALASMPTTRARIGRWDLTGDACRWAMPDGTAKDVP